MAWKGNKKRTEGTEPTQESDPNPQGRGSPLFRRGECNGLTLVGAVPSVTAIDQDTYPDGAFTVGELKAVGP